MTRLVCAVWLGCVVSLACASAWADESEAVVRYDGYHIVRVHVDRWDQIEALHALGATLLSEREGPGVVDYVVPPEGVPDLASLGMVYKVLNDDVQKSIDTERIQWEFAGTVDARDPNWFVSYKDLTQVNAKLNALVADRPDLVTLLDLGTSLQGRHIYGVRITGPGTGKPAVQFNGCHHAREWISVMVPMWIADRLVYGYDTDPRIQSVVNGVEVYVIPVVNVDGYVYTWTNDRLWRKNRRPPPAGSSCRGVDDNRNYGVGWGGAGSSSNPCDETYRGTAAFSEPETAAMRSFTLSRPNIAVVQSYHSYSQLILSPWGYTNALPTDYDVFFELMRGMRYAILAVHGVDYGYGPSYSTIYPASGVDGDWYYGYDPNRLIFAFTTELRDTGQYGFELPADQIIPTCEENFAAALYVAEWCLTPVKFRFPDGLPGRVEPDTPTDVRAKVFALGMTLNTSSLRLYARIGSEGPFTAYPLTPLETRVYRATLPAAACGETIYYYFAAQTTTGVSGYSPAGAPAELYSVMALPLPARDGELHDCDGNGVIDACDIAAGVPDCNGNGYPDSCDLAAGTSTDCNANGVLDECDLSSGLSEDCNENGILDECDRAACNGSPWCADCNGNGIIDACDLFGRYEASSPPLSPLGGTARSYTFATVPDALGDVQLSFDAYGDLNAASEYVTVRLNGQVLGTIYDTDGYYQCLPDQRATLTVASTTYNALKAAGGGNVTVTMTPSADVDPGQCSGQTTYIRVALRYPTLPHSTDANGDGIPDECQGPQLCPGDTNCDGQVTYADIDGFVKALAGSAAWPHWPCPWLNADCNGDGNVTYADIDAFVSLIGTDCP